MKIKQIKILKNRIVMRFPFELLIRLSCSAYKPPISDEIVLKSRFILISHVNLIINDRHLIGKPNVFDALGNSHEFCFTSFPNFCIRVIDVIREATCKMFVN